MKIDIESSPPEILIRIRFLEIYGSPSLKLIEYLIHVLPSVNLKSATFFTKFNSLGTISILFITSSVLYRYVCIVLYYIAFIRR